MLHIYIPEKVKNCPVLYMFDGQNLFLDEDATYGRSWRLPEHLEGINMMVVGLECSHHGMDRLAEYSPFPFYDEEFHSGFDGLGNLTMDFLTGEVIDFIQSEYPVSQNRNSRFIGGSSCGALMAIYGLYAYSSLFSKAVALSPYVVPVQSELMADIWKSEIRLPSAIYLSWGTNEGENAHEFLLETKAMADLNNRLIEKGVEVYEDVRIGGSHSEYQWEAEADSFIHFLLEKKTRRR